MTDNPATTQYWTDFLAYEYALAKLAKDKDRVWQAIAFSMSSDEHVACGDAARELGLEIKRSNKSNRSIVVSLLRKF